MLPTTNYRQPTTGVVFVVCAFVIPATLAACVGSGTTAPRRAISYAVLYGNVTAPAFAESISVKGEAYTSIAHAHAQDSVFGGFTPLTPDNHHNYLIALSTVHPMLLYFNVEARGVKGHTALADTAHAIPVRFDSLGGGSHDSLAVNLNLH